MSLKHTLSISIVMVLTMIFTGFVNRSEDVPVVKSLSTFPRTIGNRIGTEAYFDQEIYDKVGVDDSFLCQYTGPDLIPIQLYIGYYRSQREGDLIHSPKNCMPGSGWKVAETSIVDLDIPGEAYKNPKAIRLLLQNGNQKLLALYWFHSRGRIISSEYLQKIYLVIDSITRHRTDGSFVRLIAPVSGKDESGALTELKQFAETLVPILNRYLPS